VAKEDDIPVYSSDLIDFLMEHVRAPKFPTTQKALLVLSEGKLRALSHQAGARELVEWLHAWRAETEAAHGAPETDDQDDPTQLTFPEIFGTDGKVAEIQSPVRMVVGSSTGGLDVSDK
jgi:hypothetical protein